MKTSAGAFDHPGVILKRLYLEALQISNAEFAKQLGVSGRTISKLVNGRRAIYTSIGGEACPVPSIRTRRYG